MAVACVAGRSCCGNRWLWPVWLVAVRVALERPAGGFVGGQTAGLNPFKNRCVAGRSCGGDRWLWPAWLVAVRVALERPAERTDGCGLRGWSQLLRRHGCGLHGL
eukprot:s15_g8.t1